MRLPWVEVKIADQILGQLQTQTKAHEKYTLRIYDSVASAITEATRGATQLYSDKFSIAVVSGNNPYLASIPESFSRMGYKNQNIPYTLASSNLAWIEKLAPDTTFVLFAEDHPFTNETWNWDAAVKALAEKKIFSIVLSQSYFRYHQKVSEHEAWLIRIHELESRKVVSFLGARSKKIEKHLFANIPWQAPDLKGFLQNLKPLEDKAKEVKGIEVNLPAPFFVYFKPTQSRIHDRIVFFVKDINGDAFVKALQQKYPQLEIVSASLCSWPTLESLDWWQDPNYMPEDLQSLVAMDIASWSSQLIADFQNTYQDILQMQKVQ